MQIKCSKNQLQSIITYAIECGCEVESGFDLELREIRKLSRRAFLCCLVSSVLTLALLAIRIFAIF